MLCKKIEYNETNLFSKISLDYRSENPHFSSLISNFPNLDNFENQITEKSKNYNNIFRKDLTDVLNEQYKNIELCDDSVILEIEMLFEKKELIGSITSLEVYANNLGSDFKKIELF